MHDIAARNQNGRFDREAVIAAIVILASILYRFFDRVALYHDEIINTGKAGIDRVFDYAMRPLFYAINTATVEFLGAHPLSISFVLVAFFFVGGLYTYRYLDERFGHLWAISGVAAYAWLGWNYTVGIAAMPHLMPSVMVLAAWYYYQRVPAARFAWVEIVRIALLLWASVLSHPTAVAVVIPFCIAIGARMIWALKCRQIDLRQFLQQATTWVSLFALLLLATELAYRTLGQHESFIGSWVGGIARTSGPKYAHYFQPFSYYFLLVAERLAPLLAAVAFLWGVAGLTKWLMRRGNAAVPQRSQVYGFQSAELMAVALTALCIVSLQSWKFERVLPGFMPLLTLAMVAVLAAVARRLAFARLVQQATAIVVILCAFWQFASGLDDYKARTDKRRGVYSAFFDRVRELPVDRVAYIGHRSLSRTPRYPFQAVGKELVEVPIEREQLPVNRSFIKVLRAQGYRYAVLDLSERSPEAKALRAILKKERMQRVVSYRGGEYELWELRKLK